jgi:predicted nuclease of predicted toxin-antitoxin system
MIRVLVDMNLAPRWTAALAALGVEAIHWSTIGARDASDRELFSWAATNAYIVLTCDLDFTHLLALTGSTGPSVVLLRARDTSPANLAKRVAAVLHDHWDVLAQGALVAVDDTRQRIHVLPLRVRSPKR